MSLSKVQSNNHSESWTSPGSNTYFWPSRKLEKAAKEYEQKINGLALGMNISTQGDLKIGALSSEQDTSAELEGDTPYQIIKKIKARVIRDVCREFPREAEPDSKPERQVNAPKRKYELPKPMKKQLPEPESEVAVPVPAPKREPFPLKPMKKQVSDDEDSLNWEELERDSE
jgi:hypothetical protein